MDSLEAYLTGDYVQDKRDCEEIDGQLEAVAQTFIKCLNPKLGWHYEHGEKASRHKGLSHSTNSMILAALLRLLGRLGDGKTRDRFPSAIKQETVASLSQCIQTASDLLVKEVWKRASVSTESRTFGNDDVFTHCWLAEISKADWSEPGDQATWKKIAKSLLQHANEKLRKSSNRFEPNSLLTIPGPDAVRPDPGRPLPHAFPAMRLIQAVRYLKGKRAGALPTQSEYFERTLHQQLSFSAIPDSRFDPAEMMFCLEGMLLCQRDKVDRGLFGRVLTVLATAQQENAHWRPVRPYLVTPQGYVLFPVSIEVANSLLRSSQALDEVDIDPAHTAKCISLLRRYWHWLRVRRVHLPEDELIGWHSEHVNDPTLIHLWQTSQVLDFLLGYKRALSLHIARTTLDRSRFLVKRPKEVRKWEKIRQEYEPTTRLGEDLRPYRDIGRRYVIPHLTNEQDKKYSLLLYGPPGTGKTALAENVAKALQLPLITITVSDFLEGGEAQIEARAKNIFKVLEEQPPHVVLFDEIDHFLLDRDSERYSAQDSVFQFMTPGMLTKLAELRRAKRVIFIIATNYEDRIDPAIKRTGRIDEKYLILPPDRKRRSGILDKLLDKETSKAIGLTWPINGSHLDQLADASLFLGYNDIEAVVKTAMREKVDSIKELCTLLEERARTTSLEAYSNHFPKVAKNGAPTVTKGGPIEEFLCLVALHQEDRRKLSSEEEKALRAMQQSIGGASINSQFVETSAPRLSLRARATVVSVFAGLK